MNPTREDEISTSRLRNQWQENPKAKNALTDETIQNLSEISLPAMTTLILELE